MRPTWTETDGFDADAMTFDGKPVLVKDLDTACLKDGAVLTVVRIAMMNVESSGPGRFAGLQQVGEQLLVVGDRDANTVFLRVCWECKWLTKAHRPDCAWKLVRDVNRY